MASGGISSSNAYTSPCEKGGMETEDDEENSSVGLLIRSCEYL
eukprot:CAMPEP_0170124166 /NCGR_PEP_ID=MMETSP0020_2-20130122/18030_1 /TAXON_ID=98059 /ORGANISM="Dinobryon sp., Strain UTEXLB2267" /LENGTH=42 /DNA_ID= /DNA_START= /DNA_END= /DNA_ORIENTATION=